ncbi:kynurenine--oxoglutarate transaminase 3 [Folsomia candida]|uniref:Kynurenine--oxoglutarate transaminase 3 n=1 Tax=Folsomia candida TaxID=158441 RepID=A0A226E3F8_FOLCA|nr:kynurenine--oxoglutarate transaminase 3 [Folsomia candida]OXA51497.1 Kynurenine--oxoglutarate transaminase 3 [Folsomia candida]
MAFRSPFSIQSSTFAKLQQKKLLLLNSTLSRRQSATCCCGQSVSPLSTCLTQSRRRPVWPFARLISTTMADSAPAPAPEPSSSSNTTIIKEKLLPPNPKFSLDTKYHGLEKNVWVEFIELNAQLKPLNLGQGFPDFMPAESVVKELARACEQEAEPLLHQYTRSMGHPRLVKALAKLYSRLIGKDINPNTEVLVTGGAYGSLFAAIMSHVGRGDEVIIVEPFFDCYEPLVKLAGGTPRFISLKPVNVMDDSSATWKLDEAELRSLFNEKTKAIILNTPNNPLGKVFSREELTVIAELCKEFNILVISDEVYEWLVYEGSDHVRIASLPGMWERTITIGSAGKTFSLTGWKLGWSYGSAHLIKNMQVAHQNCVYTCQTPGQEALAVSLEKEIKRLGTTNSFFYKMATDLKRRRDMMAKALKDTGMNPVVPEGGYFMLANWTPMESKVDLSSETDKCADYRFVKWFAKKFKLLGIPPSAFYSEDHKHLGESYIRLCFYKKTDTLQQADEILKQFKNS